MRSNPELRASRPKLRASRIVAICRIALTLALLLTMSVSAAKAGQLLSAGLLWILAYLAFGLIMLDIAWRHWWLNHQLRFASFAIDALAAFLTLYWLEGEGAGPLSPFMAFYAYLVITATILWRPRGAAVAISVIIACYIATGLLIHGLDNHMLTGDFGRRLIFMTVIGGFIFWYGLQRTRDLPDRLDWALNAAVDEQIVVVQEFILRHINCTGMAVAWMPDDEPWIYVSMQGNCGSGSLRLAPDTFAWDGNSAIDAILFDRRRQRGLLLVDHDRIAAIRTLPALPLADCLSVSEGVLAPIQSLMGKGSILLTGISGLAGDHLHPVRALAEEIGYSLDRHETARMMRDAAAERVKDAVARDLHDGVAQSLAGASFRLEALRQALISGRDVLDDLAAIQQSLAREEAIVQGLIAQLRGGDVESTSDNCAAEIAVALSDSAHHWGVLEEFDIGGDIPPLRRSIVLELQQLVREAVANAVRHGEAGRISLALRRDGDTLQLTIADNGKGFPEDETTTLPRSILDRVTGLGGAMEMESRRGETRLTIAFPLGVLK